MVLDTKTEIESRLIGERQLAPELIVTRRRGHTGLVPDMGEMGEFQRAPTIQQKIPKSGKLHLAYASEIPRSVRFHHEDREGHEEFSKQTSTVHGLRVSW